MVCETPGQYLSTSIEIPTRFMPMQDKDGYTSGVPEDVPLCVDLDGTLIQTDSLAESVLLLVARQPWFLFLLPFWVLQGRASFKAQLARHVKPNPVLLPYNRELLAALQEFREQGRRLILVTAAHEKIAQSVSNHLKLFTQVFASEDARNLKGETKAHLLVSQFGARGFDYIGDSKADIPVWRQARLVLLANATPSLERRLSDLGLPVAHVYKSPALDLMSGLPRLLRLHQWLKNLLVFIPLATSLSILQIDLLARGMLAFLVFGLAASSTYVINDLIDLESDRQHARKRNRPFASGLVPLWVGFAIAPILLLSSFFLAALYLPTSFVSVLIVYLASTFAYSLYFKRVVLVDVMMLAGLYTLRIIAGSFVFGVELSFWLLGFSMFIFLSLALIKRFTELLDLAVSGNAWVAGRGYKSSDLRLLMSLGTSSGYLAVLVLALYIHSPEVTILYAEPRLLWLLCPLLLYWIGRMWMVAERSNMHEDPVVFAAKDRITHVVVIIGALTMVLAAKPLWAWI